jgi:hypothetical protein
MKGQIADSNKAASKQSSAPFADSTEPVSMPACGGKRFKLVVVPEGINYGHARASAEMAGGRLAVIRCAEENALAAKAAMSDDKAWFIDNYGNGIGPWLGGFQKNPGGPRNESWTWVSGEPFSYTNWDVNQPDNAHQGEDHLQFFGTNKLKSPFWNDIGGNAAVKGYIVEFAKSATP